MMAAERWRQVLRSKKYQEPLVKMCFQHLPAAGATSPTREKHPDISRKIPALIFLLFALAGVPWPSQAQQTIVSFTPPAAGAPAGNLATYGVGFELGPTNEMYWWSGYGLGGEIPENCQIGYNYDGQNAYPSIPVLSQSMQVSGAARDSEYFYFADNDSGRIYRVPIWSPNNAPPTEIPTIYTPPASGYSLGAVMLFQGLFYWSDYNGTYFDIMAYHPDGTGIDYVKFGSGNKIIKMVGYTYNTSTFTYADA